MHRLLENNMPNYRLKGYHPAWTLFPVFLPILTPPKNADLIHTTPDYAIFSCYNDIPLILTVHNYVLDSWMRQYSSFFQNIHYRTDLKIWFTMGIKKARQITAVSGFIADILNKEINIRNPVKVIYNGVDEKVFVPKKRYGIKKSIKVFFSGNLSLRKGAQWLPKIGERTGSKIKIFYTSGLRKNRDLKPTKKLIPLGAIPFAEMPKRYPEMDILLMPTVREGFGLAVAEAMSCGLPVVASNCSSIPELIDEGKGGFLCPVGDVDAFGEKINILAESPNLRKEMGEYNRAKVEKMFTLDRMVREYKKLFEEVMEKGG